LIDILKNLRRQTIPNGIWVGLLLCLLSIASGAKAQTVATNADHAVERMAIVADFVLKSNGLVNIELDFMYAAPVRLKLIQKLLDMGFSVYDSSAAQPETSTLKVDPMLTYRYIGTSKGESIRQVIGTIGITLTRKDGSVVATHVEKISEMQTIKAKASDLDDGVWPMVAFASIENGGRQKNIKRLMEPALIVTAAAVTVFLLFNVRSQ
jgi:hypothetical protein